ncbi:MAG TPA: cupin domain-containing protein [Polyangiales bacterium]|jgi:anti-sigma factor ChrR (cupin superfamily)
MPKETLMKLAEPSDRDAFLNDLAALGESPEPLARTLPDSDATPSDGQRARVLAALDPYERFARFEDAVAQLLKISRAEAATALRRIDDPTVWRQPAPGARYLPIAGGPDSDFVFSGFLRVEAGATFPPHEHLGEEITFVLQGAFEESVSGEVFGPGQPSIMPAGSRHTFRVLAEGPHLIGLITVRVGARFVDDPALG